MGSSQIIKMKIEKVFKKHNTPIQLHHCSISEATSLAPQYDVVFCSANFVKDFAKAEAQGTIIIGLKNLLSEQEIESKVVEKVQNK